MQKLSDEDLYTLEAYDRHRDEFRARVMDHKQHRRLPVGDRVILLFEDRLTIQYQIQEMLRIQNIFTGAGIFEALESCNRLIPDGSNWNATMVIEYADAEDRRLALEQLVGIEDLIWAGVEGAERVFAVADESPNRVTVTKALPAYLLRFDLPAAAISALKAGATLSFGVSHEHYDFEVSLSEAMRESLIADLA